MYCVGVPNSVPSVVFNAIPGGNAAEDDDNRYLQSKFGPSECKPHRRQRMQTSGPKQTPQVIYVRYRWLGMRAIPARNVVTRRPNCEIPLDEEISRVCDGLVRVRDTRAFQRRISTGTTLFLRRGYVKTARCEGTEQRKTQTDTTQQHSPWNRANNRPNPPQYHANNMTTGRTMTTFPTAGENRHTNARKAAQTSMTRSPKKS
jgi:hypothetical protein